ncbi:MAG: MarR family transcriptional regulator [Myxococcaceae bacterium]
MGVRPSQQIVRELPTILAGLLDVPTREVDVEKGGAPAAQLVVRAGGHVFVVEVLAVASPGSVAAHAERVVTAAKRLRRKATPLLAVPYMTGAGRRVAEGAQVPWFDLSGNAHIVAPGLRIIVEGRLNRFPRVGRPASVFAPKSARLVRWLLMHPERASLQRELARATEMDEGMVSRLSARLEADNYVVREPSGALRVKDPALLLDAWQAEYRFERHVLIQGSVAARSGDALTRFVGDALASAHVQHAATGLSAAWQFSRFASFRIATFFVSEPLSDTLRARLGFREEPRGANLWLVVPNDAGVFQGVGNQSGVRCVHPVQTYVDLKSHPERATEAAERLRTDLLATWRLDG